MSGSGSGGAAGDVEQLERLADRDRDHAPGQRGAVCARSRNRPAPSAPPSSWIVCIGTMHSANRLPSSNSRASASTVRTSRSPARRASSASSSGSRSSAVTRWPVAGEVERRPGRCRRRRRARDRRARGPASATAAGPRRSAALEVVPDHAHRGTAVARLPEVAREPAATSSSRSSSSAVYVGSANRRPPAAPASAPSSAAGKAGTTWSRSASTPAYLSRSASSAARVPGAGDAADAWSQELEVGVPDPRDVPAVGGPVVEDREHVEARRLERQRAQDLVGAGRVLDQQDRELDVADLHRSARPNAAVTASRPSTTCSSPIPRSRHSAAAPSAL